RPGRRAVRRAGCRDQSARPSASRRSPSDSKRPYFRLLEPVFRTRTFMRAPPAAIVGPARFVPENSQVALALPAARRYHLGRVPALAAGARGTGTEATTSMTKQGAHRRRDA